MITTDINGNALSAAYDAAIRSDNRSFLARLYMVGGEVDCAIKRLEILKGSCGSTTEFTVGNVIASTLTGELLNLNDNIKGQEIEAQIGLLTDEATNTYEYISLGSFVVSDVKKTLYGAAIEAHGKLVANSAGAFHEPATKTLARIGSQIGIELGCTVSFDSDIDTTLEIESSMAGITTYQAIQIVASVVGGYAIDTADGNVKFCLYKDTETAHYDAGMMRNLPDVSSRDFEITGVQVVVSEASTDDDGAIPAVGYSDGDPVNFAATNPYMTADLFEQFKGIVGYTYRPATIDLTMGDPRLEGSDVCRITDADGSEYTVPCHVLKHIYTGGFRTEIDSVRATNLQDDIGTKTPFQRLVSEIKSGMVAVKSTAQKARRIAADTAQYFWFTGTGTDTGAHITEKPKDEFLDDPANGGGNLLARSNGIAIRDGLDELATFGADGVQVGQDSGSHTILGDHDFKLSKGAVDFFSVEDLSGKAYLETTFIAVDQQDHFPMGATIDEVISVTVNGSSVSWYVVAQQVCLNSIPGDGAEVVIQWKTSEAVPAFRYGKPATGNRIGVRSFSEGDGCIASGLDSHAEGQGTIASGEAAHAEGDETVASGDVSHTEGMETKATRPYAHAEGEYTEAAGWAAHAEGQMTTATGDGAHAEGGETRALHNYSHAGGYGTETGYQAQTVIGRWNVPTSTDAFVVGWGADENTPKNILALETFGDLTIAGRYLQSSDKRLKEHIGYLDDDAVNFVQALKPAHYKKAGKEQIGLYAQDVEDADKWGCLVGEINGFKTLDYIEIIAPLITYCQRLEKRIRDLEAKDDK